MANMVIKGSVHSVEQIDREKLCFSWIEDKELFKKLRESGMRAAHFGFYTCAPRPELMKYMLDNFKLGDKFSYHFDFVEMPPAYYFVTKHSVYYDDDFKNMISIERKRIQGWKLRIATSAPKKFDRSSFETASKSAISQLRMLVGDQMAWNFDFDFHIDLDNYDASVTGEESVKATLDPTCANSIFEKNEFSGFSFLDPLVSNLLEQAWLTQSSYVSFLMLWTIVEVRLGNGFKRKRFCKDTICSEWLNDEVVRLHRIRSDIVHHGRLTVSGRDIVMVKGIARISLMQSVKDQRFATEALKNLSETLS